MTFMLHPQHSPYFKALIKSWLSQEQRLLELHISDSEQAGAERMLQCAYSGSVGDATAEELLACMVLADRWASEDAAGDAEQLRHVAVANAQMACGRISSRCDIPNGAMHQ